MEPIPKKARLAALGMAALVLVSVDMAVAGPEPLPEPSTDAPQDTVLELLAAAQAATDKAIAAIGADAAAAAAGPLGEARAKLSEASRMLPEKAWTSLNDGAGSGLDADALDGLDSAQLLRSDQSGRIAGDLKVDGTLDSAMGHASTITKWGGPVNIKFRGPTSGMLYVTQRDTGSLIATAVFSVVYTSGPVGTPFGSVATLANHGFGYNYHTGVGSPFWADTSRLAVPLGCYPGGCLQHSVARFVVLAGNPVELS